MKRHQEIALNRRQKKNKRNEKRYPSSGRGSENPSSSPHLPIFFFLQVPVPCNFAKLHEEEPLKVGRTSHPSPPRGPIITANGKRRDNSEIEREWFEQQQKSQAFSETFNMYGSDQRT